MLRCLFLLVPAAAAWAQDPPASKLPQPCVIERDDKGPPKLRRGARPTDAQPQTPLCEEPTIHIIRGEKEPAAADPVLSAVDRARLRADRFTDELPNFICEQLTRRLQSGLSRKTWNLKDTLTSEVFYVDRTEEYRNTRRNGKPVPWEATKATGAWSSGEYGTTLRDVMSPATDATFTLRRKEKIGDVETEVYDVAVMKSNSHWRLEFDGVHTYPKYRGAVWIDPQANLVRRIEMEALELEPSFPISHAEMTVDFGPVKIAGQTYTLPLNAANLACFRTVRSCVKNEIEFRNYRKFTAESSISTTESTVTFDKDIPAQAPPTKKK